MSASGMEIIKTTLRQAVTACGMPEGTFYGKARKLEKPE